MNISFYHYFWPHLLYKKKEEFNKKISEYLVIYNLIIALEKKGIKVTKYSKTPSEPYRNEKEIIIFRNGIKLTIDLIKFIIKPPDYFGLVSKSIYNSKTLIPILRLICRMRGVKILIFMGHDESFTSMAPLIDESSYKYDEDNFWDDKVEINRRLETNKLYKPNSRNEFMVVPSSLIKENCVKEGWPDKQIIILPHGVDPDYFKPANNKIRKEGAINILFAGNGATRKGLSYLIKAVEKLQKKYEIRLSIVSHNISKLELPNSIIYKDITDDQLLQLYQSHDIFVLPSLLDGWGLTASEAMSCGLPVVVSELTGIKDIIINKKNGFIIKPKEVNNLFSTLKYLIDNPEKRKKIGMKAREVSVNNKWEIIGQKFYKMLDNIN